MANQTIFQRFPIHEFDPSVKAEATPWLVDRLWQRGKINGMFGQEKAGKSRLLGWILTALLGGRSSVFSLRLDPPARTLYLAGEETIADVTARFVNYAQLQGAELPANLDLVEAAGMRLEQAEQRKQFEAGLLAKNYDLLVIDPLRRVHSGDENDNTIMAAINNDLRRWSNTYGISILLLHHTGKLAEGADHNRIATWSRGSSDLAAILDTAVFVDRIDKQRIKLVRAGRYKPEEPLLVWDRSDEYGFSLRHKDE